MPAFIVLTLQAAELTLTTPHVGIDCNVGDAVTAVIGADNIRVHPKTTEPIPPNSLKATLISESFVGSVVTLWLDTPAGELRVDTRQRDLVDIDLVPGTELNLRWPPVDVYLLAETKTIHSAQGAETQRPITREQMQ